MSVEDLLNILQTSVLLFVFLGALRLIKKKKYTVYLVFFAFAVASALLSNLYWFVYDLMRPGTRMPFAANEIGEWALFLMLGASLQTRSEHRFAKLEMFFAALFATANTALWIAWSGEWVEDILTGVVLGYLLCHLVAEIKQTEVFAKWEWRLVGFSSLILIAAQAGTFFAEDALREPLDLFCYFLLFAMAAYFFVRAFLAFRTQGQTSQTVGRTFVAFAWSVITMYMSADCFYMAALGLTTISFPMMLLALRKEASEA